MKLQKEHNKQPGNGGHFPDANQTLLLKAALKPPIEALMFFGEWLSAVKLNNLDAASPAFLLTFMDQIDMGSQRLLLLVVENIGKANHPFFKPLNGYIKNSWVRNQRISLATAQLAKELQEAGIPNMIIKGISLSARYYPTVASRPMYDGDLLIPFSEKRKFLDLLSNEKFTIKLKDTGKLENEFTHATHLIYQGNVDIDLHWNIFSEYGQQQDSSKFVWQKAQNIEWLSQEVLALDKTHEFFVSLVHARGFDPVPPLRWVADCTLIMKKAKIDWQEFEKLNKQYSYKPFVKIALPYLKEHFCPEIPSEVVERATELRISTTELAYHESITRNIRKNGLPGLLYYGTKRRFLYYKLFLQHEYPTVWHYLYKWYVQRFKKEIAKSS